MSRQLRLCIAVAVLVGASSFAVAQGRAGGAGRAPAGVGSSPVIVGQAPSGRLGTDSRRQDALKKQEAERRRAEGEAHNRSADARAEHAPNEHAADEAIVAEGNAEKKDARSEAQSKDDNKGKR